MLDKNSQYVMIGESYLSYLFAIKLLNMGKKVLLIDDERIGFGLDFGSCLSELELAYLGSWARESGIDLWSEEDNKKAVSREKRTFVIGKRRILLGRSVGENLEELFRKFPSFFSPLLRDAVLRPEVEKGFMEYIERKAHSLYHFQHFQNYTLKVFEEGLPLELKELFEDFKKRYQGCLKSEREGDWEKKTFLYQMRALHHQKLSLLMTEFDLFHLFLCMISPLYKINEPDLIGPIKEAFISSGGLFKRASVEEWEFDGGRPWCLSLSTFEGVIRPRQILLMGSVPSNMPIELGHGHRLYRAINLKWTFQRDWEEVAGELPHTYSFCDETGLGSPLPMVNLAIGRNEVNAWFYREIFEGEKVSFFEDGLRDRLVSILRLIAPMVPVFPDDVANESIEFTRDLLVEKKAQVPKLKHGQNVSLSKIPVLTGGEPRKQLKDVHYFGHFSRSGLGLLSTMVDMREKSAFL